jgi:hypothetical protein
LKGKAIVSILLPILIITVGIYMNFQEFLMGSPATIKNLVVTSLYLATWIVVLVVTAKSKNRVLMKFYSVFWVMTLFFAFNTGYANIVETNGSWAIPFVILFLTQWYGLKYFVGSFLTASILIACISLIMVVTAVLSFKKVRY